MEVVKEYTHEKMRDMDEAISGFLRFLENRSEGRTCDDVVAISKNYALWLRAHLDILQLELYNKSIYREDK